MTTWRYKAAANVGCARRFGEIDADSPADARAALRRIGLQVIDLKPLTRSSCGHEHRPGWLNQIVAMVVDSIDRHLRRRRQVPRTELYDSLATMLESGMPLLEAIDTIHNSLRRNRFSAFRSMLITVRDQLRNG